MYDGNIKRKESIRMDMKHDGYNKYQIGGMVKVYVRNTRHRYHNPLHNDVMGIVHLDCHYPQQSQVVVMTLD